MAWLPVLTLLLAVGGTLYTKRYLRESRVSERDFLTVSAFGSLMLALVFAGLTGQFADWKLVSLFDPKLTWVYGLYVLTAVLGLWLYLQGFRRENLIRVELAEFVDEIGIITAVGLVFPDERDAQIYVAAAIAFAAYAFGHFNRNHLTLQFGERLLLLASLFYAAEAVLERYLLITFSPLELLVLREVGLFVAFLLLFGLPSRAGLNPARVRRTLGAVGIWFAYHLCLFASYDRVGVTPTVLTLLALPVLLSIWSWKVRRERVPLRLALAGVVLLASIAYALSVAG